MEIVKIEKLTKSYLKESVLKDLSFSVKKGLISGIIGPNGAGKSTLLRIIAGIEFPDEGDIFVAGKRVKNFADRKAYVSYMPENMNLYPDYYVYEFLDFFHRAVGFSDEELLKALSLKDSYDKKIKFLSKGWNQRLKLYTALSLKKPIVILDEPFDGFDPLQMVEIMDTIRRKNRAGITFILSIHQLADAEKICDYYILLDRGNLVAKGTIDELSESFSVKEKKLENIFFKALQR